MTTIKKINPNKQNPVNKKPEAASKALPGGFLQSDYFIPAVLFLLCLLLYGNTVFNEYAIDDRIYTTNSFILKGFSAFKDIFDKGSLYGCYGDNSSQYRPLVLLNIMTEVAIFGLNPHVSHFFSVLFFAISVIILYFFLKKILKNYNPSIALAATLLFAFHPIHTEVVANIKSRDEILGLLFGLISFYYIIVFEERHKIKYYIFSLVAFFMAIFCKENCLTFVAVIPLLLYYFTSTEIKKIGLKTLPYIALAGVYLFIRSRVLQSMTFTNPIPVMNNALMSTSSNADRTATSFILFGKYIYMTIIPYPLSWDYSYNQIPIVTWGNVKPIASALVCTALIVYAIWGIKRKSIYSFLIAFFFITLFISSNLVVKIAATFGERFLYVPSLSFCIALPILIAGAMKLDPKQLVWQKKNYFFIPILCILAVYTAIVIPRNAEWKNDLTIEMSGVLASPNSGRVHNALGTTYRDMAEKTADPATKRRYYSLANEELKKATRIFFMDPDCYFNLGECYYEEGYADSALPEYKMAVKLNPEHSKALNNLGMTYNIKMQYDSALPYLLRAYKADSNNLAAIENIALSYLGEKNYASAFHYDSIVLKKDPGNPAVLKNMAMEYTTIGAGYFSNNELDKALAEFEAALKCDTVTAGNFENIGVVYLRMGKAEKAKIFLEEAVEKDPQNETFKKNLQSLK